MKSVNIGILLCVLTVATASFFVFSKNTTDTATELKVGEPIESVLVPDQISDLGLLGKNTVSYTHLTLPTILLV